MGQLNAVLRNAGKLPSVGGRKEWSKHKNYGLGSMTELRSVRVAGKRRTLP